LEALEARIKNQLQETLNDFKKNLFENFSKFQQDESLTPTSKQLNHFGDTGKGYLENDTRYLCLKVEFPRWEDGDLTNWISRVEFFFTFIELQKTLK
ncbi:hypothetical protein BHE74_00014391, partial [Ensete ventricosum]